MSECEHDLAEMDTACADGMCPLCLAAEIEALTTRVQYLVDHWPVPVEDGGITFPDGEFWKTSS